MPTARICLDCNHLYSEPSDQSRSYGRCPPCRASYLKRKPSGKHKQTPTRALQDTFYRSPAWTKTRRVVLARDGACTYCGTLERLTVHHVVSIRSAPEYALDPENLITLCRSCHGRLENEQKRRR